MLKRLIIIILLCFPCILFAEQSVVNIQHWDLPNKTRVFFVRRTELPLLDVEIIFTAGSAYDEKMPGISAITNAMIGEGADNLSADQVSHAFESVGAEFHTIEDRDMSGAELRTSTDPNAMATALHMFSLVINSPSFSDKELGRVKQQLTAQSQSELQEPGKIAGLEFFALAYKNNFYAHNPLGTEDAIHSITASQLADFYKKYYTGANANLIIVGDVTEDVAKSIATEIASHLPTGKPATLLSKASDVERAVTKVVDYPLTQSTILMGQVGISRSNPDYFPLIVGNAALGGLQSSILYREIREKRGLAYVTSSGFVPLQYRGPFLIAIQTKSQSVPQVMALTHTIFANFVHNGPTAEELETAKKNLIHNFPITLSSNKNILDLVAKIAFYHRPLDYLDTYQAAVSAVTTEQVKAAFQKNIALNKLVTVVVGNNNI